MSDLSRVLLTSEHHGVHEQFDAFWAATCVYKSTLFDFNNVNQLIRRHQKKHLKKELRKTLRRLGYNSWFLLPGLAYYAFEFWELHVKDQLGQSPTLEELTSFELSILKDCAQFLDNQFAHEGRADVIGYLRQT